MDKLNQWLTLTANIAVIAGIAMLAVEIRQNTEVVRVNTAQSLASEMATWNRMRARPELAQLSVLTLENGYASLSPVQQEQYTALISAYFHIVQNTYVLNQQGHIDPQLMSARYRSMVFLLSHAGPREVWEWASIFYNEDFREYINTVVLPEAEDSRVTP